MSGATRISQAELNGINAMVAIETSDHARKAIADLIGEVSKWRRKARKLGEHAAKLRTENRNLGRELSSARDLNMDFMLGDLANGVGT